MGAALYLAAVVFTAVAAASTGLPRIGVMAIGDRHWRLTQVQSQTTELGAAQAMLMPRAKQLCVTDVVRFGRYRYEFAEPTVAAEARDHVAPSMTLVQEITCGGAEPVPPPVKGAVPRSDAEAMALGLATARRYIAARDGGDVAAAVALVAADAGIADVVARDTAARGNLGPQIGVPRYKVTLYRDPPNAPGPGLYIAVDFALAYVKAPAVCGYIVLREPPEGMLAVTRQELGVLDRRTMNKIAPAELAAVRDKLLCNVP